MAPNHDIDRHLGWDHVARAGILPPAPNRLSWTTLHDREISDNEGEF